MTEKTIKLETGYEPKQALRQSSGQAIEERVHALEVFARAMAVMLQRNGEGEKLVGEFIIDTFKDRK